MGELAGDMCTDKSKVELIMKRYEDKLSRIESMEKKLDEKLASMRRRASSLIGQVPSLRNSHLRVFCSHQCKPLPITMDSMNVPRPPSLDWTLQLEGKLLIGHIDHANAKKFDEKVGYKSVTSRDNVENNDEATSPVNFTQFFSKIECQFSTIYVPKPNPMAAKKKPTTKKSRRSSKGGSTKPEDFALDPKTMQQSQKTHFQWVSTMSHDAEAMHIRYPSPNPTAHSHQIHSVVATIQLYPKRVDDQVFQVSRELAVLFPGYGPDSGVVTAGMKRPASDMSTEPRPIPLNSEIDIPNVLTLPEIVEAFFVYIQDRRLSDESVPTLINCDAKLQSILQVPSFQFSELRRILLARQLIRSASNDPIHITYIMKGETALVPPPPPAHVASVTNEEPDRMPVALLQLDMDVAVPNFMLPRCRNLIRRMNRRGLEVTTARNKTTLFFLNRKGVSDVHVKRVMHLAGGNSGLDYVEAQLASAQAAPQGSAARRMFELDAQISALTSKVEERRSCAERAWDSFASLRNGSGK